MSREGKRGVRARQRGRRGGQDQALPVARTTTVRQREREREGGDDTCKHERIYCVVYIMAAELRSCPVSLGLLLYI